MFDCRRDRVGAASRHRFALPCRRKGRERVVSSAAARCWRTTKPPGTGLGAPWCAKGGAWEPATEHASLATEQITALTELERDALSEIANIAMGHAANSIRLMVGHQVLLSVPAVEILSKKAAALAVATPDNRILVAVRQDFKGAFSGSALLIFPETIAAAPSFEQPQKQ
jgi:hypothetical protein